MSITATAAARARQSVLLKPPGSLGRLESIAARVAGLQGRARPEAERAGVLIFAGDHGLAEDGVSIAGSEVTAQMCAGFAAGLAAVSVLARRRGAQMRVVALGVAHPVEAIEGLVYDEQIAPGTRHIAREPAMTEEACAEALAAGVRHGRALGKELDVLALGEMGIGNTSSAAAIYSALYGLPAATTCGRGTGISDEAFARKVTLVERALARAGQGASLRDDPLRILRELGGYEIAGMIGAIFGAAAERTPVVVDGFIATAAAALALAIEPTLEPWLFFGHVSGERAHRDLLARATEQAPLIDLDMRLGEGSGALIALGIIADACALHNEMGSFEDAGVSVDAGSADTAGEH